MKKKYAKLFKCTASNFILHSNKSFIYLNKSWFVVIFNSIISVRDAHALPKSSRPQLLVSVSRPKALLNMLFEQCCLVGGHRSPIFTTAPASLGIACLHFATVHVEAHGKTSMKNTSMTIVCLITNNIYFAYLFGVFSICLLCQTVVNIKKTKCRSR